MNELHSRLSLKEGLAMPGNIHLKPFEGEITLPVYTRINGEEVTLGEITLPIEVDVNVTFELPKSGENQ